MIFFRYSTGTQEAEVGVDDDWCDSLNSDDFDIFKDFGTTPPKADRNKRQKGRSAYWYVYKYLYTLSNCRLRNSTFNIYISYQPSMLTLIFCSCFNCYQLANMLIILNFSTHAAAAAKAFTNKVKHRFASRCASLPISAPIPTIQSGMAYNKDYFLVLGLLHCCNLVENVNCNKKKYFGYCVNLALCKLVLLKM